MIIDIGLSLPLPKPSYEYTQRYMNQLVDTIERRLGRISTSLVYIGNNLPNVIRVTLSDDGTVSIPKNNYIKAIYMRNTTANAVTGGIKIGTTAGGVDVVAAQAVGANAFLKVADADVLIKGWTADQTIYIEDVTAWNSANVNVTFETILI